jgi:hypothetical protein
MRLRKSEALPRPFPLALGENRWSKALLMINQALLFVSKRLFAYQICMRARVLPETRHLLKQTISATTALPREALGWVA